MTNMPSPAQLPQRVDSLEHARLPSIMTSATLLQAKLMQEPEQDLDNNNSGISTTSAALPPLVTEQTSYLSSIPVVASPITANKELPPRPPSHDSPTSPDPSHSITLRPSLEFSLPQIESDSDDDVRRPMPKDYPPQVRYSAHLSAAESSSISKWSDEVLASTVKPKPKRTTKIQPDSQVRPKTSGYGNEMVSSRRANLPTTVRISNRSPGSSSRPGSQQSARSVPARFIPSSDLPSVPMPPIPSGSERLHLPEQQHTSQSSSFLNETPAVAPEKLRLMKALQMRKRKQLLAQRSSTAPPASHNLLASTDSSQSTFSQISRAHSLPIDHETASQNTESVNKHQSHTTSPTSIVDTSDNHSTKPSSLSEDSPQNGSRTSLSSETGSSTTPKAEGEVAQEHKATKGIVRHTEAPQLDVVVPMSPLQAHAAEKSIDGKGFSSRPLTYLCATADFLADIEEEDRERPVSIIKDDGFSGLATPDDQKVKRYFPFDSPVSQPAQRSEDVSDVSDDELLEELHNATVHEAKPVSVNRTPATPVLSSPSTRTNPVDLSSEPASGRSERSPPRFPVKHTARSLSNDSQASTTDIRRTISRAGSTKSLSTALPQWPPPPAEPVPAIPKQRPFMGASISKRVKTFEGLSQRDSLVLTPPAKETVSRSTSLSTMLKRSSFLSHTPGEDGTEKSSSRKITSPLSSPLRSTFNNSEIESPSKPWLQRPGTSTEVYSPIQKGQSVSVTARIIRDPVKPKSAPGTSDSSHAMHASPLIVEHDTNNKLQLRPPVSRDYSTQSMDSLATSPTLSERRRFSFSSHKSGGQKLSPVDTKSHRLSFAGHWKSPKSIGESSSIAEEKKQSRTSRMLKRLSGLGKTRAAKELIAVSPSREAPPLDIAEEPADSEYYNDLDSAHVSMRHVVDVGEVNVQFADTLLWKRRFLRVDDQGYLIFAPPTNDAGSRGKSRKIHLEEFYKPTLPDLEREEMAWSILLDLKAGGTVQCACESKNAQRSVLKSKS